VAAALVALGLAMAAPARADGEAVLVDRVVARFRPSDATGEAGVHVVFARELSFEARIEAMSLGDAPDTRPSERHIRAALARHVTETLLGELPLEPAATPIEIGERAARARTLLEARVGGRARLARALALDHISGDELDALMRRAARASLYLDRMVAPLVEPSDAELRELHATGQTPFSDKPFVDAAPEVRRWVVSRRLAEALDAFYQRARARILVTWAVTDRKKASAPTR
jgi:hypothetical protein